MSNSFFFYLFAAIVFDCISKFHLTPEENRDMKVYMENMKKAWDRFIYLIPGPVKQALCRFWREYSCRCNILGSLLVYVCFYMLRYILQKLNFSTEVLVSRYQSYNTSFSNE